MRIAKWALIVLASLIGVGVLGVVAIIGFVTYRGAHYYDFVATGGPIEAMYTPMGPFDVSHEEIDTTGAPEGIQQVWYPSELPGAEGSYPVVVIANGTGVPASKTEPALRHLASWGFIVIGNEDENSRTGESSVASLQFILDSNDDPHSTFHDHVDTSNVGIAGHSQGGVGAINAATARPGGDRFTALFAASPTGRYWGQDAVFGPEWSYDATRLAIPSFLIAGTGAFDAGTATDISATDGQGISPLWSLEDTFADIPDSVTKVIALRDDTDHSDTLTTGSGYMTAWFRYWLQHDQDAAGAFTGTTPEITLNDNWKNVRIGGE